MSASGFAESPEERLSDLIVEPFCTTKDAALRAMLWPTLEPLPVAPKPVRELTPEERSIESGRAELIAFYDRPNGYSGD